ncbi:MAG: PIN domain-containing protein [Anaerolineales bacterium]|nr:PIN domain-containing protein [Anaerolineales bacterium]
MLIVLDTNILVSALLKRDSYPGRVLDLITSNKVQVALDSRILTYVPDPHDLPFAEGAIASQALALVTGNERHYPYLARYGVGILSPAKFLR